MPASIVGEIILRPLLELLFHFLGYFTGYAFLKICSFGKLGLASWDTVGTYQKKKWEWTPFLRVKGKRVLKSECTTLIGILVWVGIIICGCYLFCESSNKAVEDNAISSMNYGDAHTFDIHGSVPHITR